MEQMKWIRSRTRLLLGQFCRWRTKFETLRAQLSLAQDWSAELQKSCQGETDQGRKALLRKRYALACELEGQIEREMANLNRLRQALAPIYESLSPREQEAIQRRYEKQQSWVQIGFAMGCDESFARRLERRGVDEIARSLAFDDEKLRNENFPCKIDSSVV